MNCDLLKKCCAAKDWDALQQNARKVSQAINKKEYDIGQAIADLKSMLTDANEDSRANGMKIVSFILLALDCKTLTESEVSCIVEFYNNRLKDRVSVIENSLPGLTALCHFSHFNFQMATSLFYTVQNDVSIQLLKPEFKQQLYKIVKHIFERYKLDFTNLESNFVYGFLRIVDAETSPTCLVDVFELFYSVASIKKFDPFKEDLFEAMACYFPIIYSKQKNDKHLETKMHLSNLLNRAMSATSSFAEYVIQLALEKLESESIGSKQSCYQLLQCALPGYTVNQVEPFTHELWTFIRIDSLRPTTEVDDLATHALLTLTKLGDVLCQNPTVCTPFLEKIWKDLEISLKSPELNLINSTVSIFAAMSSNNLDVFNFFFERSHPILLQNFLFNNIAKHQLLCLDALYTMLLYGKKIGAQYDSETVVRLFNMLIDHSSNDVNLDVQKRTLLFLNELVCLHRFEEAHIAKLVHYLLLFAEQSAYKPHLLSPVFELITNMSIHDNQHVLKLLVDPLRMEIDTAIDSDSVQLQDRLIFQLCSLRSASSEMTIFNHIVNFFVTKLIAFSKEADNEFYKVCSLNLLETLQHSFDLHHTNGEFVQLFHQSCISPLLAHFTRLCFESNGHLSWRLIQQLSLLFSKFLSSVDVAIEQKISADIVQLAMHGNISGFVQQQQPEAEALQWATLEATNLNCTQMQFFFSLIYAYFSSSCTASSEILLNVFHRIKSYCLQFALNSESSSTTNIVTDLASMILSQIVLKFDMADHAPVTQLCEQILSELSALIGVADASVERRTAALGILMWISRSLFIRHHRLFNVYVEYLLQLLQGNILTTQVLKLVDILYSSDDHFHEPPSAQVQSPSDKFSLELHNLLLERYSNSEKKHEFLYLCMSHMRFIPPGVFASQMSQHMTIILNGLEATQFSEVNLISLAFIENIIRSDYSQVEAHIVRVFRSVIQLARDSAQMATRKKALDCVCLLIDISTQQDLLNLKVEFLQSLQPTLGDRKRLVRASAAKAFCKLSMLGQPGNRSKL